MKRTNTYSDEKVFAVQYFPYSVVWSLRLLSLCVAFVVLFRGADFYRQMSRTGRNAAFADYSSRRFLDAFMKTGVDVRRDALESKSIKKSTHK
ncbi:hypothetical protein E2C01_055171 [Portunus trituberculatus]|uniref:Uncharacterized protein n=1 Tax=Portunus trituberculatus TaxID=210409 RepID=A0A5B7GVW5_PORTR|nr:hypothetical protein [Portunus trituberculatus]